MAKEYENLIGQIFGHLLVYDVSDKGPRYWKCKCLKTGKEGVVEGSRLKNGRIKSGYKFPNKSMEECVSLGEYINQFSWCTVTGGYLEARSNGGKILKHQEIFRYYYGEKETWTEIDHVDGNKDNNYIGNLRQVTRIQNSLNTRRLPGHSSQYKGVSYDKKKKKWITKVTLGHKKPRFYKEFKTEEQAALAYDNYMLYEAPRGIVEELDLPGNIPKRFIPILNFS